MNVLRVEKEDKEAKVADHMLLLLFSLEKERSERNLATYKSNFQSFKELYSHVTNSHPKREKIIEAVSACYHRRLLQLRRVHLYRQCLRPLRIHHLPSRHCLLERTGKPPAMSVCQGNHHGQLNGLYRTWTQKFRSDIV